MTVSVVGMFAYSICAGLILLHALIEKEVAYRILKHGDRQSQIAVVVVLSLAFLISTSLVFIVFGLIAYIGSPNGVTWVP